MKLLITTLAVTAAILLATALPAHAEDGTEPVGGCQPGADNGIVQGWQLLRVDEFAQFLVDDFGAPSYEIAFERAETTYDFCDHNNDGYACVMVQNFPNDASGSSKWWLAEDNHPFNDR
jgi:hypothetical protein